MTAFLVAPFTVLPTTCVYFLALHFSGLMGTGSDHLFLTLRGALVFGAYGVVIAAAYTLFLGGLALSFYTLSLRVPNRGAALGIGAAAGTLPWLVISFRGYGVHEPGREVAFVNYLFFPALAFFCSVVVAETFWWLAFGQASPSRGAVKASAAERESVR
jgi:hypothetical protein